MGSSRVRQFLLMLPFFLVGIAVPAFLYGFSGDGPPNLTQQRYSPLTKPQDPMPSAVPVGPARPAEVEPDDDTRPWDYAGRRSWDEPPAAVGFARRVFEGIVDRYVSQSLSPATIKLGAFLVIFGLAFMLVRLLLAVIKGTVGNVMAFLVHKAAAPMFMGFLAVGSTWGIHQTIAAEFGMNWAATTVTLTAAIASLFALAGVKIR